MERRTVSVRGGMFEVDVREYGDATAEPLLFLHGSGGLNVDPYLDRFGERFRVIAPLHPGYGESTGLEHLDDIIDFAIYYHDFMDAMGLESAHIVGHSLGGMLAAEIAALDPSRVRKLVLANPIGLWRDDAPVMDFFSADVAKVQQAVWADPTSELVKARRPDMSDVTKLASYMYDALQSLGAAAKFQWPIPDKGLKKRIHRIAAPTLIVWGAKDGLVPPIYAEEFRSRIKASRVAMMLDAAHQPFLEQPDEWNRLVTEFLLE